MAVACTGGMGVLVGRAIGVLVGSAGTTVTVGCLAAGVDVGRRAVGVAARAVGLG
jgi:hypothetical protein